MKFKITPFLAIIISFFVVISQAQNSFLPSTTYIQCAANQSAVLKYNLSEKITLGKIPYGFIISEWNTFVLRELCQEKIPDGVIMQLPLPDKKCNYISPQQMTQGMKIDGYIEGWGYSCPGNPQNSFSSSGIIFLIALTAILTILLYPVFFIALPVLFFVFLGVYLLITYKLNKRKHEAKHKKAKTRRNNNIKLINYFLLSIFYGVIGGLIAAYFDKNKKHRKYHVAIGITAWLIIFIIALCLMMQAY